jgi:hypothetical protein
MESPLSWLTRRVFPTGTNKSPEKCGFAVSLHRFGLFKRSVASRAGAVPSLRAGNDGHARRSPSLRLRRRRSSGTSRCACCRERTRRGHRAFVQRGDGFPRRVVSEGRQTPNRREWAFLAWPPLLLARPFLSGHPCGLRPHLDDQLSLILPVHRTSSTGPLRLVWALIGHQLP